MFTKEWRVIFPLIWEIIFSIIIFSWLREVIHKYQAGVVYFFQIHLMQFWFHCTKLRNRNTYTGNSWRHWSIIWTLKISSNLVFKCNIHVRKHRKGLLDIVFLFYTTYTVRATSWGRASIGSNQKLWNMVFVASPLSTQN